MFRIIISYFVLFHEVLFFFFLNVKSKMKGLCPWYRIKLELEKTAHLPEMLLQPGLLKHNGNTLGGVFVFCLFV